MTLVVADTSPISYLVLIGHIQILQVLYTKIIVPSAVFDELSDTGAPSVVRSWINSRPDWLDIRAVDIASGDPALEQIDPGERAAIILAQGEPDVLLLIDDAAGRAVANRHRIPNTGTLGVLRAAAFREILDLPTALSALAATNFRISQSLADELLLEDSERKGR